jgi:hypothetical protein
MRNDHGHNQSNLIARAQAESPDKFDIFVYIMRKDRSWDVMFVFDVALLFN